MVKYKNINGDSNVVTFEEGIDYIDVVFGTPTKTGRTKYRYTHSSAGKNSIDEMKRLARQGYGLNSFINLQVRDLYVK